MIGVITNSKEWIFTWYDMMAEVKNSTKSHHHKVFEFSETFTIFEIDEKSNEVEINEVELAKVVKIIENLILHQSD